MVDQVMASPSSPPCTQLLSSLGRALVSIVGLSKGHAAQIRSEAGDGTGK